MKYLFFVLLTIIFTVPVFSQNADAQYTKVLTERATKIVKTLEMSDTAKYNRVVTTLVNQYKSLGEINDNKAAKLKNTKSEIKDKTELEKAIQALNNEVDAQLYNSQCTFLGNLSADLSNQQIEAVKDGMTYGVLMVTYKSYNDMIPTLKENEKRQIYAWLVEAREHAIGASSSNDKHGWFGKYKGRINNYLASLGYDLQKERKAWGERVKASGGRL